jgi:hypothetical protein
LPSAAVLSVSSATIRWRAAIAGSFGASPTPIHPVIAMRHIIADESFQDPTHFNDLLTKFAPLIGCVVEARVGRGTLLARSKSTQQRADAGATASGDGALWISIRICIR